jgi:hypothetical protein
LSKALALDVVIKDGKLLQIESKGEEGVKIEREQLKKQSKEKLSSMGIQCPSAWVLIQTMFATKIKRGDEDYVKKRTGRDGIGRSGIGCVGFGAGLRWVLGRRSKQMA